MYGIPGGLRPRLLPGGTRLWHGTDCAGAFPAPDAPAWFALDEAAAWRWAAWRVTPPEGRMPGSRRALAFEVAADVALADTGDRADWEALCDALCGDPEAGTFDVAQAAAALGLAGWRGRAEVMLAHPVRWLRPLGVVSAPGIDPDPPATAGPSP